MAVSELTPSATTVVSLDEAKAQCRVIHDAEDNKFANEIIPAAQRVCETKLGLILQSQQFIEYWDGFPIAEGRRPDPSLALPNIPVDAGLAFRPTHAPLITVTTIAYTDANGVSVTVASADYTVDKYTRPARIVPAYGETWPTARAEPNSVSIRYTAGFDGTTHFLPKDYKHAVLMLVEHFYRNRGAMLSGTISKEIEFGVNALLARKLVRFG